MANITLYKHGDLEIYLELIADDSIIGFQSVGGIPIDKEYRHVEDDKEFNKMAKELEELIEELNDISKTEKEKVQLYLDYISYWDGHQNTYIIDDEDELAEYLDENGNIDKDNPYVFKLNGFYVYDEV